VEYKCYHATLEKEMYRVREYFEYVAHAKERIEEVNNQLKAGYVLGTETAKVEKISLQNAIVFYKEKKYTPKPRSKQSYVKKMDLFEAWADGQNLLSIAIDSITKQHVQNYLDYARKIGNCDVTINSKAIVLTNFFNLLVDKEIIAASPIAGMKHLKEGQKYKELIKKDEIKRFSELAEEKDSLLYCFVNFLYHNHTRPNELRQLQRKHLDIVNNRLTVPDVVAKNGDARHTIITPPLRDIILKHRLHIGNQEHYIFGHEDGSMVSQNYWGWRHLEFRREHEFSEDTKLYRWKDVGVTAYYMQFKDAYYIMKQCGHKSLEQTQKYLSKDLGIFEVGLDLQNSPTM
jgi:integrase